MKRLSIALAALGLSAGALAAYPAATDPTVVNVPQLPGGFFIGGTAYYLQPSDTNGDLDYASVNTGTTSTFFSSLKNVEPGYDWGWGINIGYIFPNTGNDVNLSYFRFHTRDTSSVSVVSPADIGIIFDQIFSDGFLDGGAPFAAERAEYDLDQVDLTAGQYINVGCRLTLHPNVGLRWAQLERKLSSAYGEFFTSSTTASTFYGVTAKSDFSGIGPLAGIDATYYIGMGFGAVAHFDSALLIGNINSSTNGAVFTSPLGGGALTLTSLTDFSAGSTRRVVPVMDGKLGLDYTYVFNNTDNSDLTLEAGWMVSNYFNAVDRLTTNFASSTSVILARSTSDVGLNGPYVSLVFHA